MRKYEASLSGIDDLIPLGELAELTPFSESFWRKRRQKRDFPFVTLNNRVFARVADLKQWIERGSVPAGAAISPASQNIQAVQ